MALIPRPVEPEAALESLPLTRTEEGDLTSNSDLLKAGSLTNERRTSPSPIYTGLPVVTYNNGGELPGESLSPDRNTSLVNSIHREIITPPEPPHLWQGFRSKNSRHGNENRTRAGTISTRNTPGGSTSIGSVSERADPFRRNFLSYSPTSRVPIHSRASMIRPAVGRKNTPAAAKVRPNRTPTFPKPLHIAQSPIPLRNSPFPVTVPRDRVTEYSPTVFSVLSNDSILTPPWDDSQPTYPDHARTTTYNARSLHSIEEEPTPYALLPSVPSPRVARFQDLSAFWGPKDISSGNNASFATGGSNAPLIHSVSQPRRIVQRSGVPVGTAHRASMHPVKDVPLSRRGSDGQELDQTQWWGLVRSAATKP
ncbi:hypothetical protein F5888DRAFT_998390 [Russula emetica]|nr:hypothetical protein F5888DRAFT_998390 [Russula emetica]